MKPRICCFHPEGYQGHLVEIEVEVRRGIPAVDVIGLPGTAVREARDRTRSAFLNSGFEFPPSHILFNLHPAGLAKEGTAYDLAMALALLHASGQVVLPETEAILVLGELSLSGRISAVEGVLAAMVRAREAGIVHAIVPQANHSEAMALEGMLVYSPASLGELRQPVFAPAGGGGKPEAGAVNSAWHQEAMARFAAIRGHEHYKLALIAAAAGAHHLMVAGPPGQGKTMGLQALAALWPPLDQEAWLESRRLYSLAGQVSCVDTSDLRAPCRWPHHSASPQAILGGGRPLRPGEISLAHRGVLVLDEAPEFNQAVLQGLREPLESGTIAISRAGRSAWYPAEATVCLALNPCPCGNYGRDGGACLCRPQDVVRYWARIGQAVLDRMDIRVGLGGKCPLRDLDLEIPLDAANACLAISRARQRQQERFGFCNSRWRTDRSRESDFASTAAIAYVAERCHAGGASWRAYTASLRLALTLADLEAANRVELRHVRMAMALRDMEAIVPGSGLG